jgi:hypothetical protein
MRVDSLEELRSAFSDWREQKKHAREAVPEELLVRARRAAKKYGTTAVVRVTRVERSRLFRGEGASVRVRAKKEVSRASRAIRRRAVGSVPAFSRLELSSPTTSTARPLAEVERAGVTLRVFEVTPATLELLATACGLGGAR